MLLSDLSFSYKTDCITLGKNLAVFISTPSSVLSCLEGLFIISLFTYSSIYSCSNPFENCIFNYSTIKTKVFMIAFNISFCLFKVRLSKD